MRIVWGIIAAILVAANIAIPLAINYYAPVLDCFFLTRYCGQP